MEPQETLLDLTENSLEAKSLELSDRVGHKYLY